MSLSRFDFIPKVEVSPPLYFFIIFITCIFPIIAVFLHGLPSRGSTESLAGYRKIGLRVPSNLKDEYKIKYLKGRPPGKSKDGANNWSVKSLWIYPVKSCKGVELFRGSVVATGMLYDRQFSFAQLKPSSNGSINGAAPHMPSRRWEFITQRQYPLLARVTTEVWVPDISLPNLSPKSAQSGGFLIVKFPYQENAWRRILRRIGTALGVMKSEMHFKVPFNPTEKQIESAGYQTEVMTIWKDAPQSLNMSVHVPPELSHFLGISNALGLFRVAPGQERTVFRCAPRKEEMGWQPVTGFADAYPLHLINLASVRDVGRRVVEDIPQLSALRFRPNIIITGPEPYAEDTWKKIRIGQNEYFVSCRTTRCKLPNTDQNTGVKHLREPDRTLRSYRCIDEGAGKNACLGMQMVPVTESSVIKVGDVVEVLETGQHYYIKQ